MPPKMQPERKILKTVTIVEESALIHPQPQLTPRVGQDDSFPVFFKEDDILLPGLSTNEVIQA
jgi:hypothetical protein